MGDVRVTLKPQCPDQIKHHDSAAYARFHTARPDTSVNRQELPRNRTVNDDPTSDAAFFTPPDRGDTGRWPSPPPSKPAPSASAPAEDIWSGFEVAVAPPPQPEPQAPPADLPADLRGSSILTSALAPPTPLIRPVLPRAPEPPPRATSARPAAPAPETETETVDDGGGPGWGLRRSPAATPAPTRTPIGAATVPVGVPIARTARRPAPGAELPQDEPIPTMPWDRQAKARPTRRYVLLGVGLFALCGLTAMVLAGVGRTGRSIQQPETIGVMSQVDSPDIDALLQNLDRYEHSVGASNVVTGAYGADGTAQMMLVVVQGGVISGGGDKASVDAFMRGLTAGASGSGWVLDPAKLTVTTANGTTFECDSGPSSNLDGATLSTCAWTDAGIAGAVVDVSGLSLADTLNEAVTARAAAEH